MKLFNRASTLVLAGALSLSLLSGCQNPGAVSSSAPGEVPEVVDVNAIEDICVYLSGLDADEVVAKGDDIKITAGELMYWIVANCDNLLNYYYYYYGVAELPWDTKDENGQTTLAQFILDDAVNYAVLQRMVEKKGAAAGLTVSQEEKDAIQNAMDAMETEFAEDGVTVEQYLRQQGLTSELYRWNYECDYIYEDLTQVNFGPDSPNPPTEQSILAAREENGEYKVKHILLASVDTATREPLDEETVAEKKAAAEKLLAQLRASEDPMSLFDEYMNTLSEDPGLASNPDGYVFTAHTSVDPAFEEVALALEYGQISDVVEGESGYHIILRLPLEVNVDEDTDDYITFKMAQLTDQWIKEADIKTTKAFDKLDARAIYERQVAYRDAVTKLTAPAQEQTAPAQEQTGQTQE